MKKQTNWKTRVEIFKNVGGNIPGGNFLGGDFPGGNWPETSSIDLSFANKTMKELITRNKIIDNFVPGTENRNLDRTIDEGQTLLNDELNETLDGNPTTLQLVGEKEL